MLTSCHSGVAMKDTCLICYRLLVSIWTYFMTIINLIYEAFSCCSSLSSLFVYLYVGVCLFVYITLLVVCLVVRGVVSFLLLFSLWVWCVSPPQVVMITCDYCSLKEEGPCLQTRAGGNIRQWGSNYNHSSAGHRCGFSIPAERTQSNPCSLLIIPVFNSPTTPAQMNRDPDTPRTIYTTPF